ncbi:PREDICTED: magnesium-dependent phosphatase 1 isoform X1 [Camelina sativa]|uniref:Magnesium-dependent phosphatase 1 isoform X1 n=1 Tax=Camelina sativa TaxID=90675 RepID=A0ABM0ZNG7_CAMSA|nr:PREDICTED: magnesium-dependent phosphatase 1 isoform X1 [Camelina sativa]
MGDEKVKDEAMQIMGMFQILPRLVVFDLDYTLWPFYCECLSKREMPSLYPQAKGILSALKEKGIEMAIASRSPTSDIAITFLDKLNIKPMFVAKEIYSSWTHKTEHFQKIHTRTGVPFTAMLFFDDEDRNIKSVSKMGVTSILVGNGVTLGAFRQGLTIFTQNQNSVEKNKQVWPDKYSGKPASSETNKD